MKFNKKKVGLVAAAAVAVGLAFVAIKPGAAQAAGQIVSSMIKDQTIQSRDIASQGVGTSEIRNQTIQSGDIAEAGVGTSEVRNGTLTGADMNPSTVKRFLAGERAQAEIAENEAAWSKDEKGIDPLFSAGDEKTVADLGGSWGTFAAPRATEIDSIPVTAGEYLISTEGIMTTLGSDAEGFFGQIAVRSADGTTWGKDLGTCFTADFGSQANREASCSTTRVVTFTEDTDIKVFAFGYQRDGQGGVSDAVKAKSFLTATPVID